MKTTITRRTALAVPVTLPLLPMSAYAAPGNATDGAWAAYEVATARYTENKRQFAAFEAALPTGPVPCMADFEDVEEWRPLATMTQHLVSNHRNVTRRILAVLLCYYRCMTQLHAAG